MGRRVYSVTEIGLEVYVLGSSGCGDAGLFSFVSAQAVAARTYAVKRLQVPIRW